MTLTGTDVSRFTVGLTHGSPAARHSTADVNRWPAFLVSGLSVHERYVVVILAAFPFHAAWASFGGPQLAGHAALLVL